MSKNYKDTLLLPESPVPMKANLPALEPRILDSWTGLDLYHRLRAARKDAPLFLLHDGPPYANGELHMGHALNKSLKDIIVRYKSLNGFDTPFVPGWDCHGLPIEHNVMKELGKEAAQMGQVEVRRRCRAYAERFVSVQREGFKRLGCLGEWEKPYLTMDPLFESRILEAFLGLWKKGFIYRGLKPIHWCPSCRTALAASTAEAEYASHLSDAITVAFSAVDDPGLAILIWTTTPWTLPANLAVAVRADLDYVEVKTGDRRYLLCADLFSRVGMECGWSSPEVIATRRGADLEGLRFRHPFLDRTVPVILGDFVTTETGTGVVHIAPGHGLDDYLVGQKYGLEVLAPVDERGRFTAEAGVCEGENVFKANARIVELLAERGALLHAGRIEHQYPHCWRCKGPVIFRATSQWFMSIDHESAPGLSLRALALEATGAVRWIPSWGQDRFVGSVKERPDWCLSRQRSWGVPIPALVCSSCGAECLDEAVIERARALAAEGRLDEWFQDRESPEGSCAKCGGALRREQDILDVWFDSGVSWYATEMFEGGSRRAGGPPVADLYLEGSDQHRGWFQSSLWPSLALRGTPPYRAVLTHGFMLDGEGKAMHKSAGNAISPDEILKKHGADIIRLWVASENYREDVRLSHKILDQVADSYRKIRNTWRFLSAHVVGLPADAVVPAAERPPLDRWMAARLALYVASVRSSYESYAFHEVYRSTIEFATGDLSSFYLDIIKDRLYCDAADGPSRLSARITCREILSAMLRVLAPILPFTADEVWGLSGFASVAPSVHLASWPGEPGATGDGEAIESLLGARAEILKAIEVRRAAGEIKSNAMAAVRGPFTGDLELLRQICQVAELAAADTLAVTPTALPKCPRCWRHVALVDDLCARCRSVVNGQGGAGA